MKGQMFIITMVFLVGMIFAVQSNLSQYSFLDLAKTFERNDFYLLESVSHSFRQALDTSPNCAEAGNSLAQLETLLEEKIVHGATIQIDYTLDCAQWDASPLTVRIRLKSIETETTQTAVFSN